MYKEMYEGFVEILKSKPEEEVRYMRDTGKIPYFFNLVYGFDPIDILRIKTIEIKGLPDIILVLAKFPEKAAHSKYTDYIMYNGNMTKVVLINYNDLTEMDPLTHMLSFGWSIWKMAFTPVETYINIFDKTKNDHSSSTNIFYYAPAVLMIKIIDRLYGKDHISNDIVAMVINNFYQNHKILPIGVGSIRKVIEEIGIELLLDYNIWDAIIVSKNSYPGAAFADNDISELITQAQKAEADQENKNEDDQTDPV